jgi:NADPH:quinone reductase-like Zn-dependent oxidoreductase
MKAVYCPSYGTPQILEHRDIEEPTFCDNEILIQTLATSVTTGDSRVRALRMPTGFGLIGRLALGISKPRQPVLGSELSGIVVGIGKNVSKFKVNDEVILFTGTKLGCHTELKAVSQDEGIVPKPANMSFEEAAALASSGTTALAFLRRGNVGRASRVLVIGASGAVGSAAVMLSKHLGAHVTAVCSSKNLEFVSSLGADRVIDYTKANYLSGGEAYDAILDASGTVSYLKARRALKRTGRLLLVSATLPHILQSILAASTGKHKVVAGPAPWTQEDLEFLCKAVESGAYRVPIDRTYSLAQIAQAHAYVDAGGKTGNVVITIDSPLEAYTPAASVRKGEGISANLPRMRAEGAIPNI